jgi:hypothetical protein
MKHPSLLLTIAGALAIIATASAVLTQTAEPSWKPNEETVKSIEATLRPSGSPGGPLDSYARYYVGLVQNGKRIIYGNWLRGRMAQEKPGLYLRDPPSFSTGGGCDQIQLWYDVDAHQMLQIQCYGLG